jgi:hypothetical protein
MRRLFFAAPLGLSLLGALPARAQISGSAPPFASTIEGFANLTSAGAGASSGPGAEHVVDGRADLALRVFARIESDNGFALGPRVVVQSVGQDSVALGDGASSSELPGDASSWDIGRDYPTRW